MPDIFSNEERKNKIKQVGPHDWSVLAGGAQTISSKSPVPVKRKKKMNDEQAAFRFVSLLNLKCVFEQRVRVSEWYQRVCVFDVVLGHGISCFNRSFVIFFLVCLMISVLDIFEDFSIIVGSEIILTKKTFKSFIFSSAYIYV